MTDEVPWVPPRRYDPVAELRTMIVAHGFDRDPAGLPPRKRPEPEASGGPPRSIHHRVVSCPWRGCDMSGALSHLGLHVRRVHGAKWGPRGHRFYAIARRQALRQGAGP